MKEDIWGYSLLLNLSDCNNKLINSYEHIKNYIIRLCEIIKMNRYGEPQIILFGPNEDVYGYTLVQLIETSHIAGHFAEKTNSAFIDIFSCKDFDNIKATQFTQKHFESKGITPNVILRY